VVERAALPTGLASTVKFTIALPGPEPPVIFTHEAEAGTDAVQVHPDCVVTWRLPLPPALVKFPLVGAIVYVQFGGGFGPASSLTWKVADCTVMVVERAALPAGLASTVKFTVALPGPPPVIFTHEAEEGTDGVQVHPDWVVTWKLPLPPALVKFPLVGAIVYVQFGGVIGPASSLIVNTVPSMEIVAVRAADPCGLGSTLKPTVPGPG
jgi:hypothetical protein